MSFISSIIRRPVSVLIVVILITLFSLFTAKRLNTDLFPDVEFPQVTVFTSYSGANPEEIEKNITKVIEESIRGLENLKQVTSRSNSGLSIINVEFQYGSGIDDNVSNLQERINRAKAQLPEDAQEPIVFRFSASDVPVIGMVATSNRSVNDTRQYINTNLISYFEQIDGVSKVEIVGGQTKKVFVETSINRLNAFDITLSGITSAIRNNGKRSSLGYISTDVSDIAIVVDNKFQDIEELRNLVITERKNDSGESYFVRLRDIADVRIGYDEANTISIFNGKPAIGIYLYKLSDANIIDVSDRIHANMKKLESIAPNDFEFIIYGDNATFIRDSMKAVTQAAATGGFLAILVLLLFLRNIASVLVIAISMPISILLTLTLMYFGGLSINMMSLAGLTLGIGMLVDNSIVVLEHIYNKRLRGVKLIPAAEYGSREMARPVLASTLTTVLVFAPVILFKNELGVPGGFFAELSFTVVVAVLASYVTATTLVPVLLSKYIPLYRARHRGIFKTIDTGFERFFHWLNTSYQKKLAKILKKPKRFFFLIFAIAIIIPIALFSKLSFSFIPEFAPESMEIGFDFPASMKLDAMHSYVNDFQSRTNGIIEQNGAKIKVTNVEVTGREGGDGIFSSDNSGKIVLYYDGDVTNKTHDNIVDEYAKYQNVYPGINIKIGSASGKGGRSPGGSGAAFSLELKSNDYDKLQEKAAFIKNLLTDNFKNKLNNIADDQPDSALEYNIKINRTLANSYGASVSGIVEEIQTAVQGKNANRYTEGADEYDILVRLNKKDRSRSDVAEQLYINSSKNTRLPLANLLDKNYALGVTEIRRSDLQRTIIITADTVSGYTSSEAVKATKTLLSTLPRDEDVLYSFTGEYEDTRENQRILMLVFLLAVIFIYGIMASQFESFLDPFIIIGTVPLTFSGVVLIYVFSKSVVSSFTLIGVVMLVGIAVNHGIVLVDYINLLRKRGYGLRKAILAAAESRMQPILMTTATTVFGLLPMVVLNINGIAFIKPIAMTIVGGLTVSAFLSLYFIPLFYFGMHKLIARRERKKLKKSGKKESRRMEKEAYTIEGSKKFNEEHSLIIE